MNDGAKIPDSRFRAFVLLTAAALAVLGVLTVAILRPNRQAIVIDSTVYINTDPVESLARLPGVGFTTASDIVDYRRTAEKPRAFETALDLQAVKGIGVKKAAAMEPYISFE